MAIAATVIWWTSFVAPPIGAPLVLAKVSRGVDRGVSHSFKSFCTTFLTTTVDHGVIDIPSLEHIEKGRRHLTSLSELPTDVMNNFVHPPDCAPLLTPQAAFDKVGKRNRESLNLNLFDNPKFNPQLHCHVSETFLNKNRFTPSQSQYVRELHEKRALDFVSADVFNHPVGRRFLFQNKSEYDGLLFFL